MPTHTCTFSVCFGFPFNLGCSHFRWKPILLWFSSIMEHSSLKITSSNCLLSCRHRLLNFSHLIRFGPHINWQYFVTVHAQPSFCRRGFTLSCKNCSSKPSLTLLVSFGAVNLSFFPFQHQWSLSPPRWDLQWGGRFSWQFQGIASPRISSKTWLHSKQLIFMSSSARYSDYFRTRFSFEWSLMIHCHCKSSSSGKRASSQSMSFQGAARGRTLLGTNPKLCSL